MISIIIPIYNAENTLKRCVDSLLNEHFADMEILLIDNNSKDNSIQLINKYSQDDHRIRTLKCEPQGVSHVRNMGIREAAGEHIFFLDADDYIEKGLLASMMEVSKNGADLVCVVPKHIYLKSNGTKAKEAAFVKDDEMLNSKSEISASFARHLSDYSYFFPTKLYRTSLLKENDIFFDESLSLGEDLLFNLAVLKKAQKAYLLVEPKYCYVHSSDESLNNKYRADLLEIKTMLTEKITAYLEENEVYELGKNNLQVNILNDVFACLVNAFKQDNPTRQDILIEMKRVLASPLADKLKSSPPKDIALTKKAILWLINRKHTNILYAIIKLMKV